MNEPLLKAVRARAKRLRTTPSTWARQVLAEALDARKQQQQDAAIAAAVADAEARAQPSADARVLAAQLRPLAINVNDLDRRARRGEPVELGDTAELLTLLREVRALLGDRSAR